MASPGIPPSFEQLLLRRIMAAVAALIVVSTALVLGWFYRSNLLGASGELHLYEPGQTEALRELAAGWEAVRPMVLHRLEMPGVTGIDWGERYHEGHHGWYRFEGALRVLDAAGQPHGFHFKAEVHKEGADTWVLERMELEPQPIP